jgi:hypothetical protein
MMRTRMMITERCPSTSRQQSRLLPRMIMPWMISVFVRLDLHVRFAMDAKPMQAFGHHTAKPMALVRRSGGAFLFSPTTPAVAADRVAGCNYRCMASGLISRSRSSSMRDPQSERKPSTIATFSLPRAALADSGMRHAPSHAHTHCEHARQFKHWASISTCDLASWRKCRLPLSLVLLHVHARSQSKVDAT